MDLQRQPMHSLVEAQMEKKKLFSVIFGKEDADRLVFNSQVHSTWWASENI